MAKAGSESSAVPAGKMFSPSVVAALLSCVGITSISTKQYELLSAIDGVKTASAFQHDFRAILREAKEIKARVDAGEEFEPVTPSKKRGAASMEEGLNTPPTTPKKVKASPTKPKSTPKPRGKKAKGADQNGDTSSPVKEKSESPSAAGFPDLFADANDYEAMVKMEV